MTVRVSGFLTGISDVLTTADAGGPHGHGLTALTRLVDVVADALACEHVTYTEIVGHRARTQTASRQARFLLGRQSGLTDAELAALSTGDIRAAAVDDPLLTGHGIDALTLVPVVVHGRPVGRLELALTETHPDTEPVLRLAAATAAHVIGDHKAPDPAETTAHSDLFIAVAGHELRTPTTVIKGYADTLRHRWKQLDDTERLEALDVIVQRADALAALADRLLRGATTTLGEDEPELRAFDLAAAVRESADGLAPDLGERMALVLPDRPLPAVGEPESMPLILGELATNAARYSPDRAAIEVSVAAEPTTALLTVADRGIGMTARQARLAFERFWQAERGDDRRYGGVGLGLYLVRQIVERQRGWVSLHARQGGGTVIEVRLPRA